MNVSEAIATRKTTRAFRSDPVPLETVKQILTLAARAPSGGNLQPWKAYVLVGEARDELIRRVGEARKQHPMGEPPEYHIYPPHLTEPYRTRRFRVGEQMYATMGISREDKAARLKAFARNWEFFGSPVGMIFTIDRRLNQGSWIDYGMFLQNIMVAARARGLDTCPQAAFTQFHRVIAEVLGLEGDEMVVCGMSLGHADPDAVENQLVTEREPVQGFVRYYE